MDDGSRWPEIHAFVCSVAAQMNNSSSQANEIDPSAVEDFAATKQESFVSTWVTCIACVICIGIFIGLATKVMGKGILGYSS